jgi:His/Glu/Gln/Arg/opine family amino acid ABC transporter permease subunit
LTKCLHDRPVIDTSSVPKNPYEQRLFSEMSIEDAITRVIVRASYLVAGKPLCSRCAPRSVAPPDLMGSNSKRTSPSRKTGSTAMNYHFHWDVVFNWDLATAVIAGLKYTLILSALGLLFGNLVGLLAAVMRISRTAPFSRIAYIYIDFFRTTPALVQLIWVFYVLPILSGISIPPIGAGVITLSLNSGAFLAEVFRAGIESIDKGQRDAAYVLGLTRTQGFFW